MNFPICRSWKKQVPYLSQQCSQCVAAMFLICRTTLPKCRRRYNGRFEYQAVMGLY